MLLYWPLGTVTEPGLGLRQHTLIPHSARQDQVWVDLVLVK